MPVRLLDVKAGTWSTIECTAEDGDDLPRPRGGHSVRGRARTTRLHGFARRHRGKHGTAATSADCGPGRR